MRDRSTCKQREEGMAGAFYGSSPIGQRARGAKRVSGNAKRQTNEEGTISPPG